MRHLIAKNTPYSLNSAYVFYLLSFVLVVYSTFLTRSGVLGDTSVHSFTEMGLEWQLIIFILLFGLGAIYFYWKNKESISTPKEEESLFSREFWMFIGSMVFLFSCLLISFTTSIPVFNKIISGIGWILNTDIKDKQRLLELNQIRQRADLLMQLLQKELQFVELKNKVTHKTRTELDKQQREYFLQQQMKSIKEELGGDSNSQEIKEMLKKAEAKKWPAAAKEMFKKGIETVSYTHLRAHETVLDLVCRLLLEKQKHKKKKKKN